MLKSIVDFWLMAITDQALISVPSTFGQSLCSSLSLLLPHSLTPFLPPPPVRAFGFSEAQKCLHDTARNPHAINTFLHESVCVSPYLTHTHTTCAHNFRLYSSRFEPDRNHQPLRNRTTLHPKAPNPSPKPSLLRPQNLNLKSYSTRSFVPLCLLFGHFGSDCYLPPFLFAIPKP